MTLCETCAPRGRCDNPQACMATEPGRVPIFGEMTARHIIEARTGKNLPPVRDMRPDERQAIKLLAMELIKRRRS